MNAPNPTLWLTLQAHDAPKLIDYFVDTFGFLPAARFGDGDTGDHAQLNWPEGSGETDYGAREFAARDPECNMWSVGDYRVAPLPA
jgi:uncharacterized glyoxalase superfamily protein PhnB